MISYADKRLALWYYSTLSHAAAAAAIGKLLHLSCTRHSVLEASGLMSALLGSDLKRMRHGFAARNGFFAALMAEAATGIKNVSREPYGGFLSIFVQVLGRVPPLRWMDLPKD